MSFRPCAVIPVYNHHGSLKQIATALLKERLSVILVDDGSDAVTKAVLQGLAASDGGIECLTRAENGGKGAAVLAGLARASTRGFSHALQIDADGQHDLDDVPAMLALAEQHPGRLISGMPQYDDSVPAARFYGRYLTHGLVWLDTLSLRLRDSMCGFRVYPVAESLALAKRVHIGRRMDFDTDIMTRLYWAGTESLFLPTKVRYPEDGISHFRMFADNGRMAWLHLRLFLGMLPRIPKLLYRNLTRKHRQHWAHISERGSLLGLRFVGLCDRLLGRTVGHAILYPVTAYFFLTHPRARRASREFLAAAGLHPSLRMSFSHFMQFSLSILDKVAAWYDPKRIPVTFPQREMLVQAVAGGQGVLLLSAHLGNLELARALSTLIPGLKVNALVYTSNARKINAMLEETSDTYAVRLIYVQEIGPDTALMLREKIAAGEVVVIVGDRTPVAQNSPVVRAEFLGRSAAFAIGPYVLANVLECPVYLFFCTREGAGYTMHLEAFAERIQLPRQTRIPAATAWAERYATRLAAYAARFPLQWYNFYDFWAGGGVPQQPLDKQD
ncbi:MAG TPA: glycosyltransferase [Gammaproteobacteria bacterium]|jgi:predicted LPLAT superfamily acyltransferase|nr:glycosyltransferase [Gammaproteobacteria bacterium]